MAKTNVTKTSLSIYPPTMDRIKLRGAVSTVIDRDINRLYDFYDRALRQVDLSPNEACLIVDCLNGGIYDAKTAPMLWASIEDGINLDGLDDKWDIDGAKLVHTLQNISEIQAMAIIDAAERYWENTELHDKDFYQGVVETFNIRKC